MRNALMDHCCALGGFGGGTLHKGPAAVLWAIQFLPCVFRGAGDFWFLQGLVLRADFLDHPEPFPKHP